MQLKTIKTLAELNEIEPNWNHLLNDSASHVPFLRHEYLTTWWNTLGGGEWDHGDLHTVTAYSDDGALVGIAPLFHTTNLDGKSALMFLGSIEISDYLDFVAHPDVLPGFVDALYSYLGGLEAHEWEVLDLYNIIEDSATLSELEKEAKKRGWNFAKEQIKPAPSISLPNSWDEYLAGIQKKQRHEIRRKIRRAENYVLPAHWYIVEDEDSLDEEIDAFLQLMAYDSEKDAFLTDVMRSQMHQSVHSAHRAGWLQLAFLEIGGKKAAGYLNFDYGNRIWVYNSGINFEFYDLSPGWVLLAYLLQWAIENGREVFDFMRGDEAYKYRFGGVNRSVMRAQVWR